MFSAPELVIGDIGSRFQVLRSQTRFRRFRGRRVPFSCFVLPDSFSAVPRALGPVFMFGIPELVFGGAEVVRSRFHVLRSRTRFRRFRVRQVLFSCFALPDSFSAVPRASGAVFIFCAPALVFGGFEGVGSRFRVLRSRTRFRLIRGRLDPFSCFALPNSFSAVTRASGPIFMFCALGHVFNGAECVGSRFHVLRSRTRFWRCGGRRVPFSCFLLPNSFSTIWGMSGPVFKFCTPGIVFGGSEVVASRFHVLRSPTRLGGSEGVGSRLHFLLP
jgi:hypothetical protein